MEDLTDHFRAMRCHGYERGFIEDGFKVWALEMRKGTTVLTEIENQNWVWALGWGGSQQRRWARGTHGVTGALGPDRT